MKHILRSPIEPEFAYFVKTTLHKKKEAIRSRIQSDLARSRAYFLEQKKRFAITLQEGREKMALWKKSLKEAYSDRSRRFQEKRVEKKPEKKPGPEVFVSEKIAAPFLTQTKDTQPFWPARMKAVVGKLKGLRKSEWQTNWKMSLEKPTFLVGIFVLAVLSGMILKAVARDTITIGFDDYKLASSANMMDLNAVQQRLLSSDVAALPPSPLEGEQCTE